MLEFEILKKFFERLTPQFSITSIIEDQVSSEHCELTFEQYWICKVKTFAIISYINVSEIL